MVIFCAFFIHSFSFFFNLLVGDFFMIITITTTTTLNDTDNNCNNKKYMYMYLYMYVYVYKNKALLDYFLSFVMKKRKKIYDGAAVGILRR